MPHAIDVPTLRLCSMLASMAFGLVLMSLWALRRSETYFIWWSASSLLYAAVIVFLSPGAPLSWLGLTATFALLGLTDVLLVAGARRLEGQAPVRPWMAMPVLAGAAGHVVPTFLVGHGIGGAQVIEAGETLGLMTAMAISGIAMLHGGRGQRFSPGRTIAGLALLAYVPGYAVVVVGNLMSSRPSGLLALIPILSDQLLLGVLNLGLLAMPVERAHRRLREGALRDPLTGAWNRAGLAAEAPRLIAEGAALVAIDVDHFKAINDRHGHATGDAVLVALIRRATILLADQDGEIARIGGDEFVAVIPRCPIAGARAFAARLRQWPDEADGLPPWTMSMGLSAVAPGEPLTLAMRRADMSLYEAKSLGRDRFAA